MKSHEANTRHQLIAYVLGSHRNRVSCEEYIKPGYADYLLMRAMTRRYFIEAKREHHSCYSQSKTHDSPENSPPF